MAKLKWKHHSPVMKTPKGLVHVIFNDDSEIVTGAASVQWNAGWEHFDEKWKCNLDKKVICYINVTDAYAEDFNNGKNRAVDSIYLQTSALIRKLETA